MYRLCPWWCLKFRFLNFFKFSLNFESIRKKWIYSIAEKWTNTNFWFTAFGKSYLNYRLVKCRENFSMNKKKYCVEWGPNVRDYRPKVAWKEFWFVYSLKIINTNAFCTCIWGRGIQTLTKFIASFRESSLVDSNVKIFVRFDLYQNSRNLSKPSMSTLRGRAFHSM